MLKLFLVFYRNCDKIIYERRIIMNVYLVSAEAYHLINKEVKKIVHDNNCTIFNMNKSSVSELLDEASYFSLDTEKKYIIASNADFFGSAKISDEDATSIENYINNPNPSTILIFTTLNGIDSRKKIVKQIKTNDGLIVIPKMDKKSINQLLSKYLNDNNFRVDYNTINYIIDNSYGSIDIMLNELDKIMLFYNKPCTLKYEDVVAIVGEEKDSNNFHFINAVIEKKLGLALKIFKSLKIYKVEPTGLIVLLAREYRLMYYVKKLYKEKSMNEICSYLGLADWQVNKLYNNSLNYNERELLNYLEMLCDMDYNIKSGIWDKDTALYGFLMEACS